MKLLPDAERRAIRRARERTSLELRATASSLATDAAEEARRRPLSTAAAAASGIAAAVGIYRLAPSASRGAGRALRGSISLALPLLRIVSLSGAPQGE